MSRLALAAVGLGLALGACRAAEPPPAGPGPPGRVVSLAPSLTTLLFRLGVGDRVVGVTRYCDDPPEAATRARIGGFADPSFEAILGLRPDLVVAVESPVNAALLARLQEGGVRTLSVRQLDLGSTWEAMRAVGAAVDRAEAAEALVAETRAGLDEASARARARPGPKPRVLFVFGHQPLVVAGPGSFPDELLTLAGAENVAAGAKVPYPKLTYEEVLRLRPDVVLDAAMGDGPDGATAVEAFWRAFPDLPAVRAGRVRWAARPGLLQPGVRVADGLGWLVDALR